MNKKKKITVRLTENQFFRLSEEIIKQMKSKSSFIREMMDEKFNNNLINKN